MLGVSLLFAKVTLHPNCREEMGSKPTASAHHINHLSPGHLECHLPGKQRVSNARDFA